MKQREVIIIGGGGSEHLSLIEARRKGLKGVEIFKTLVESGGVLDDTTYKFNTPIILPEIFIQKPKNKTKGHQRPYKFHK